MALEVYWGSGSPPAWRVLLTLEVKKLAYESKLLEFSKGQHKSPDYLKMNPRGRVPTLKDGDFVLYESLAIMSYLDRKYPDVPIFGSTPEEAGLIWRHISEGESYLRDPISRMTAPLLLGQASEKTQEIRTAADTVHGELAGLEVTVAKTPWIAGSAVSAADIAIFPYIQLLLRAAAKDAAKPLSLGFLPLNERYPRLASWVKRVEALPGYERTYPPHWK
jgi:glutathione S-transferase